MRFIFSGYYAVGYSSRTYRLTLISSAPRVYIGTIARLDRLSKGAVEYFGGRSTLDHLVLRHILGYLHFDVAAAPCRVTSYSMTIHILYHLTRRVVMIHYITLAFGVTCI